MVRSGIGEDIEVPLRYTLLFEAAKETRDDTVLLGWIGALWGELLAQSIVAAGWGEARALENPYTIDDIGVSTVEKGAR